MKINLPKDYLSYSAISLWGKNKEQFRARYYRNEKLADNVFTLFGRDVHKKLEEKKELKHIPRYPLSELKVTSTFEEIPLLGYIDSFHPDTKEFLDFKTSIRKPGGRPRWDGREVKKLKQLPFYAFLIKQKYGEYHPLSKLIWLETKWKQEYFKLGSQTLLGDGQELELSGHFEIFEREINPEEIEEIKEWTVQNANEISEDFTWHFIKATKFFGRKYISLISLIKQRGIKFVKLNHRESYEDILKKI